jgi:phosphoglycerate dehydrogenase-like enzyme
MKVAVPSISFSQHPVLRKELLASYPQSKFNEAQRRHSEDELVAWMQGCDAAIMGLEPLTERMLDALPALKVIGRMGVGLDNVDPAVFKRRGIRIGWMAGTNKLSVAELTIAFAISGLRHVSQGNADMRAGLRPRQIMGRHLSGRVVGLHGCGNVGQEVVRLLQPFGCTILSCDIADYADFYRAHGVKPVTMDELLSLSEVLSLHLPLNRATRGMYTAAVLDKLRPDCVLINTCRGGIVDEPALKALLRGNRIAAACFDVFAIEPPTDDELLNLPNLLATPHIGGSAEEARLTMGRAAIRGLTENFLPEPGVYPFD